MADQEFERQQRAERETMSTTKPRTAAVYARFSSDLQKDRSITDQIAVCETYAKREGIKVVAQFSDKAKSGASLFDRDGLMDLRNAAKRKEFDAIIVENLDRLSRDTEDLAGLFKRLNHYGVDILTVNEGKTTSIHVGIRGIVGSLFLADLSAKVKRGHDGRVREGKFPGAVTYGYNRVLGKPGEREINPDEARIIKKVFTEYAAGVSPREIAAGLTRDNIPTPNGLKHWNHQTFVGGSHKRGIIGNRLYIGELVWNTHHTVRDPDTGAKSKRPTPESEHLTAQVPHLRIIRQELWDAAHAVRKSRAVTMFGPGGKVARRPALPRNTHLLSGILRCGVCNGHMRVAQKSRNGTGRVVCAAAHQHGTCDHRKSYDLGDLEKLVLDGFRDHLLDPGPITEAVKAYHEQYRDNEKKHSGEKIAAEKQLNKLTLQIDRIVAAISDGDEALPGLLSALKTKEAERVGLQERIRLLGANNVVSLHPNVVEAYKANVGKLHKALTAGKAGLQARSSFRNLVDSIVVHPTGKRMAYEVSVFGRLAAMMGVDLFPTMRSPEEIVAAEALTSVANSAPPSFPVSSITPTISASWSADAPTICG
jgi:site-specific DNA recombinase